MTLQTHFQARAGLIKLTEGSLAPSNQNIGYLLRTTKLAKTGRKMGLKKSQFDELSYYHLFLSLWPEYYLIHAVTKIS